VGVCGAPRKRKKRKKKCRKANCNCSPKNLCLDREARSKVTTKAVKVEEVEESYTISFEYIYSPSCKQTREESKKVCVCEEVGGKKRVKES
jgi:hypothetical protein